MRPDATRAGLLTATALAFVALGGALAMYGWYPLAATNFALDVGPWSRWLLAVGGLAALAALGLRRRAPGTTLRAGLASLALAVAVFATELPGFSVGEMSAPVAPIPLFRTAIAASAALLLGLAALAIGLVGSATGGREDAPVDLGGIMATLVLVAGVALQSFAFLTILAKTFGSAGAAEADYGLGWLAAGAGAAAILVLLLPVVPRLGRLPARTRALAALALAVLLLDGLMGLVLAAVDETGGAIRLGDALGDTWTAVGLPARLLLGLAASLVPVYVIELFAPRREGLTSRVGGVALGLALVLGAIEFRGAVDAALRFGAASTPLDLAGALRFAVLLLAGAIVWIVARMPSMVRSALGGEPEPTRGDGVANAALFLGALLFGAGIAAAFARLLLSPEDLPAHALYSTRLRGPAIVLLLGASIFGLHHFGRFVVTLVRGRR